MASELLQSHFTRSLGRLQIRSTTMRSKLIALAIGMLFQAGCAGGFRVGGNNYGVGIGGYIGAVPDAIRPERSSYAPVLEPPLHLRQSAEVRP